MVVPDNAFLTDRLFLQVICIREVGTSKLPTDLIIRHNNNLTFKV